jgi:DNA-binding CsgD family transcriptional regulator
MDFNDVPAAARVLNRAERRIYRLHCLGMSDEAIARWINHSRSAVLIVRQRAEAKLCRAAP